MLFIAGALQMQHNVFLPTDFSNLHTVVGSLKRMCFVCDIVGVNAHCGKLCSPFFHLVPIEALMSNNALC